MFGKAIGSSTTFLAKVSHGESFSASPKQPQSSTGITVALSRVRAVKKSMESTAKIEIRRIRTLKRSIQPIIISAPHNQIEKAMLAPWRDSIP